MAEPLKFKAFPSAKPIFPESQLDAEMKRASSLAKSDPKKARALRTQVENSQDYYDLASLFGRGVAQTPANLERLRDGFVSLNTDAYKSKSVRRDPFTDSDSRFVGMDRGVAREIILDEIFAASMGSGDAGVPTDDGAPHDTKAARRSRPAVALLAGVTGGIISLCYLAYRRVADRDAL